MSALLLLLAGCIADFQRRTDPTTYCADLCFADPGWWDGSITDPWVCTVECEEDPDLTPDFISCLGAEGADDEGIAICSALIGAPGE